MEYFYERIRARRKSLGLTQKDVADFVGVSNTSVVLWEKGETAPNGQNLLSLARALQTNPEWITSGNGDKEATGMLDAPQDTTYVPIPFKDVHLRATNDSSDGFEIHFEEDDTIKPLFYRRDWIAENGFRQEALMARKVRGSSMEPALYEGDKVLINRDSTTPKHGVAFAVLIDGHPCIKRLKRIGGIWMITSDNPAHAKTDCPLENLDQILGEAVEKSSRNI